MGISPCASFFWKPGITAHWKDKCLEARLAPATGVKGFIRAKEGESAQLAAGLAPGAPWVGYESWRTAVRPPIALARKAATMQCAHCAIRGESYCSPAALGYHHIFFLALQTPSQWLSSLGLYLTSKLQHPLLCLLPGDTVTSLFPLH